MKNGKISAKKGIDKMRKKTTDKKARTANSTYKKLAVQWLNEVQFFNQNFVQVESFVLRNRQLLIAAKRYHTLKDKNDEHSL